MKKIIIAGSRDFHDYELLSAKLNKILSNIKEPIEIVSGRASGADRLGEIYAREHGHKVKLFPANWSKHGNSAGYIRNEQMAIYADCCVVFWDGISRGTKHMINLANKHNLPLRIIRYNEIKQRLLPNNNE